MIGARFVMIEILQQELNKAWRFYKEYVLREPKDDQFYHDAVTAYCTEYAAMQTAAGRKVLRALFEEIDGILPPRR